MVISGRQRPCGTSLGDDRTGRIRSICHVNLHGHQPITVAVTSRSARRLKFGANQHTVRAEGASWGIQLESGEIRRLAYRIQLVRLRGDETGCGWRQSSRALWDCQERPETVRSGLRLPPQIRRALRFQAAHRSLQKPATVVALKAQQRPVRHLERVLCRQWAKESRPRKNHVRQAVLQTPIHPSVCRQDRTCPPGRVRRGCRRFGTVRPASWASTSTASPAFRDGRGGISSEQRWAGRRNSLRCVRKYSPFFAFMGRGRQPIRAARQAPPVHPCKRPYVVEAARAGPRFLDFTPREHAIGRGGGMRKSYCVPHRVILGQDQRKNIKQD